MRIGRESRRGNRARVKRGRAIGVLVAVLAIALVGLVLILAWVLGRGAPSRAATGPAPSRAAEPPAAASAPGPAAVDTAATAREEVAGAPFAPTREDPARFGGRGRIRGELVAEGRPLPERWTLVLEPHPTLVGSEHAEPRRVAYEHGERVFDARDLPLGGYRVSAQSAGLNSTAESVLLVRGSTDVHVTLRLAPAGLVDGFVFDHRGLPAEGLVVTIEDRRARTRASAVVDAAGMFVVNDVIDGEYQIFFGPPARPLMPARDFLFRAPTLRWPEVRLPVTAVLRITVRDERGIPIAEAVVTGSGTPQGVASGTAGGDGVLWLPWLWPARYHLNARSPDGRTGQADVVVTDGAAAEVTITVG